ncbi:hypothetical protein BH20ACT4_BH20ACT4_03330 [soil metagenome]
MTAKEFDARGDLPDWWSLLGRLETTFHAGSFGGAAR